MASFTHVAQDVSPQYGRVRYKDHHTGMRD